MLQQLALVALAGLAAATGTNPAGKAKVVNNCSFEVTLWSVGSDISAANTLAARGGQYAEQYTRDPKTGGRSLKITRDRDGLYTGKPQTNFAYTLDPDRIWYDLSDVFGDPFAGKRVQVTSSNSNCQSIVWPDGRPPAGSQVKTCTRSSDTTLTLCA
ncbi:phase-specific protein [Cordyceps militaris CM01]|uniref:Phase-specific protein n=2 Tax=Cordyceps militaris TaxID=73501 RepID=G3JV04_CORMM|nr:phase-specific protein [Cordyceps militaris CM01]ATY65475.1 Bys1 family [Cordyceps militaris]EGX87680.1 phase-specific protein [Cordyceps militaris CM01]